METTTAPTTEQEPLKLKRFGKRTGVPKEPDPSSERNELLEHLEYVGYHLDARFTRYIRLGCQIQYISRRTGVPRERIVRAGPSQFQDQTSGQGSEFHAAHIIRVGDISTAIDEKYNYSTFLQNFAGHTQIVPRFANLGIGQDIDKIQSNFLSKLAKVDFDEQDEEDDAIIEEIRSAYLSAITKRIDKEEPESKMLVALNIAHEKISGWTIAALYEKAAKGVRYVRKSCE